VRHDEAELNNTEQVVLESRTYDPMDFAQLQIFVTVVKEGGIVKAARKLHRVPSNVTTRVKQLEDSVGAELFFRLELTTATNDALTAAVVDRRLDAAFVAEVPSGREVAHIPVFTERLLVISALDHRRIRSPADLEGDSVMAFPDGCAYRRRLNRWLGDARPAGLRFLDLCSYHASSRAWPRAPVSRSSRRRCSTPSRAPR
jgi:DNA-binding transcriptional LysR family regulator